MKEVLIDTSAWIDFLNGADNTVTERMSRIISGDTEIFICPPVLQEILQGIAKDEDHEILKEKLFSLNILELDPVEAAVGASNLYRSLRKKGNTIRKSNDVLTAYYCIYFNIPILHKDRDFDSISKFSKLKIFK